ncbi:Biopolymer transport protein ExbD/TolR [Labilithrix luteola]|uniref:Biopolymer transport protein ExbD/TolR n=1 Tax=Labilithrix luteola TaxID=1391654 RepID=A0A0K1Q701_9BACT|nr:biopolymer transporter ExbD [Labilithrix luteola]AKV01432.1 Biopolymer transport protein ExbD/TolR [Labilithrix luteola]
MGASLGGGKSRGGIVGINITPMVDVVLVLLVIMMVSATYIVAQSLKVELPKSASSDDAVTSTAQVSVSKEGKYYFKQEPVSEDELVAKLREAKAGGAELNLVISADTTAQHGKVVHVIDLAKREGISKFAINVDHE